MRSEAPRRRKAPGPTTSVALSTYGPRLMYMSSSSALSDERSEAAALPCVRRTRVAENEKHKGEVASARARHGPRLEAEARGQEVGLHVVVEYPARVFGPLD